MAADDPLALAFRQLNRRERTVGELRRYLLGRIEDEAAVEAALQELCRQGYLDDGRYARIFTEDKLNLEGWGRERIRRALLERGVARPHIDAALDGLDDETERERAQELLERRIGTVGLTRRERERAAGLLLRRGYSNEVTWRAVDGFTRAQGGG